MTIELERSGTPATPPAKRMPRVATARRTNRERLLSLDGLRGIAAFIVVIHHLSLIATPYLRPSGAAAVGSLWWWLENTPLKLLTAGRESVMVFFVLSGLVVALPALKRADFSWPGLVASRFVRLFLPAWAAVVLATGLFLLVPRSPAQVTAHSWLAGQVQTDWKWDTLLSEFSLMIGSVPYNNVLWTLRWEFLFSLLLPGFLVVAMALHRWWLPVGALALGLSVLGVVGGIDALGYLPVFFLGTLIAARLRAIERWSDGRGAKRILAGVLAVSAVLLIAEFLLQPVLGEGTDAAHAVRGMETLGAVGIVVVAAAATRWRRLLEARIPQVLGKMSFSLYLVHLPVLATLAFLLGDWNWPVVGAIGIPLALAVGWLFFRYVERPLHRVARNAKRATVKLVERSTKAARA